MQNLPSVSTKVQHNLKKAIFVMGPPGAGKGTQADFIADYIGVHHFNIGGYFRRLVAEKNPMMTKDLIEDLFDGEIIDPHKFLSIVQKHILEISEKSSGIVFSGQPRSILEAFGDRDLKGFMDFIVGLFGKENITLFNVDIPEEETIERNMKRGREDDKLDVLKVRLEEYRNQTLPILDELEKRGFNIINIDGMPSPEIVFAEIKKHIEK